MSSLVDLNTTSQAKVWSSLWFKYESENWPLTFPVKCELALHQRRSFFDDLGLHSTPNNPIFLEDRYKDCSIFCVRCLQGEDMYTILRASALRCSTKKEKDDWLSIVIHLCALCEKWRFPLIFNEAMCHFALLQDSPLMVPEHIRIIYQVTMPGSSLRRLAVDIVMSEDESGTGELRRRAYLEYAGLFKDQAEFQDALWKKFQLPLSSLFFGSNFVDARLLKEYHMKV
ncbi:hypothetical protein OCU04_007965 [Sclerotinia nivalis]|uniref:Uncharacterized protein n=1 Tax=Sclerotinia nivalis TaxID=352851 RepID=A0A9X0DIF9_9HELO|nr:hypothetical protein OCU04_007965 [Sclerotinia nivalis]